jgi:L-fuconolactonase
MSVDAHFHVWRLGRADYGWLTPALGRIYCDFSAQDWLALAAPLGIQGGVLVQAAPTAAETEFLLQVAQGQAQVLGVVGWADLGAADAPQHIAGLATQDKLKGLRPMLHDLPDADWILQAVLAPALQAMVEHDLVFDALVRPVHLPRIRELARRHPGLRIVIDHGAKPDIARGQWQPWADELRRVADETGAVCKLSGLLTEAGDRAGDPEALAPWVAHLLDCFGADRLLWGSDWPVLALAGDYAAWWQLCRRLMASLTPAQRQSVFGGNARLVYRL